jgi:uncharacterized LabA/DUF88 family protein
MRKTFVYIDGYNLYYGRLRGTGFKWLDVVKLFQDILKAQDPAACVERVSFFTAPALARFATNGQRSIEAQQQYHRAMEAQHPDLFKLVMGKHFASTRHAALHIQGEPYDKTRKTSVWELEEKLTDVNLALAMYREAPLCDQVVLCTNDSDQTPTLEALRADFPTLTIGVVAPVTPIVDSQKPRWASAQLTKHAHWTRKHITDTELENNLLPACVPTRKKPALKPEHW